MDFKYHFTKKLLQKAPTTIGQFNKIYYKMLQKTNTYRKQSVEVKDNNNNIIFAQTNITIPESWSTQAATIFAKMYLYKAEIPKCKNMVIKYNATTINSIPEWLQPNVNIFDSRKETTIQQVVHRIVGAWTYHAFTNGYFKPEHIDISREVLDKSKEGMVQHKKDIKLYNEAQNANALAFYQETSYLLTNQFFSPNSPQWFNQGIYWAYGIEGSESENYYSNRMQELTNKSAKQYQHPQLSACFISSVEDTLIGNNSISDFLTRETKIFKGGSGSGANFSKIREEGAPLSSGGNSSGLLSFLKVFDTNAGAIKSGGTTRRAAKINILNSDHKDIIPFIEWKTKEQIKIQLLKDAANHKLQHNDAITELEAKLLNEITAPTWENEAVNTVSAQNANNSVRIQDGFMESLEGTFKTEQHDKNIEIWNTICEAAHKTGDPGVQFDDNINEMHTIPKHSKQQASNPCQPSFATLLTQEGIRTFEQLKEGDTIWGENGWTKITAKWCTGYKEVNRYLTTAGQFIGTSNHKVFQKGDRIEVENAQTIDTIQGETPTRATQHNIQDVLDGLMLGDGYVKTSNTHKHTRKGNDYTLLCIGKDDKDYFDSPVSELITKKEFDRYEHLVDTTLTKDELPNRPTRIIPKRFYQGNSNKVTAFLHGLYSANGSVLCSKSSKRVTYKTTSKELVLQIIEMLSSIGIKAYFTTNKETKSKFSNGTYLCKESYDINITSDTDKFQHLIGFIQKYKNDLLRTLNNIKKKAYRKPKESYEIREVISMGIMPVFDITVEDISHNYWTGGKLVSNCSEFMFIDNSACNLAALNLDKFYHESETESESKSESESKTCKFDVIGFIKAAQLVTTVLDITVSSSSYPTQEIADNSYKYRPLGLGFANLGTLLMRMLLPYDSTEGRKVASSITSLMHVSALTQSNKISKHLGVHGKFHEYDLHKEDFERVLNIHYNSHNEINANPMSAVNDILSSDNISNYKEVVNAATNMYKDLLTKQKLEHGFRNTQVTLLAPTGTTGMVMDCQTTGIEPAFALTSFKQLSGGGTIQQTIGTVPYVLDKFRLKDLDVVNIEFQIKYNKNIGTHEDAESYLNYVCEGKDSIDKFVDTREDVTLSEVCQQLGLTHVFNVLKCANDISPMSHIEMMAACQPFLSGAISKTVNMENNTTPEQISEAYKTAYKLGLKSLAIFRDGCKDQPLNRKKETKPDNIGKNVMDEDINNKEILDKSGNLIGRTTPKVITCKDSRRKLPHKRRGYTQKANINGYSIYIRTGEYEDGSLGEIFLNIGKEGSMMKYMLDAVAISVSMGLQYGVPLKKYCDAYIGSKGEPSGFIQGNDNIKMCSSILDYVFKELKHSYVDNEEEHIITEEHVFDQVKSQTKDNITNIKSRVAKPRILSSGIKKVGTFTKSVTPKNVTPIKPTGDQCPTCHQASLIINGSCKMCTNCGVTTGCS